MAVGISQVYARWTLDIYGLRDELDGLYRSLSTAQTVGTDWEETDRGWECRDDEGGDYLITIEEIH